MKKVFLLIVVFTSILLTSCNHKRQGKPLILVFSKTAGYKHASIPNGIEAIKKLGIENDFDVDTTTISTSFSGDSLKKYSAIIFLNTTGDVLDYKQEAVFERYIQSGGGFVGVHAATDTEYDWNWYGRLVGAYFKSHPATQDAKFIIKDKTFGATDFFTDTLWQRKDELYNFKKVNPNVHVLITIDETSYQGGVNGKFHPMSWYHEYDGGRSFYTELGHTEESYTEEKYLNHLLGGIKYAIGENLELDYTKAKSQLPPDEDRFSKTQLSQGEFLEPTEMAVLPNLDVLVVQRRGEIMLYKNDSKKVSQVGFLNVYFKTSVGGVNVEEGLLGLQKDPDFGKNNWVYVYYSPADSSVNRLSRFTFKNDIFDNASEKVILEVKSQREICCHTGGSIAFGPDRTLYLSTGDNSTPFDEGGSKFVNHGYAPLNDLPGHQQYDARRSSGNTNDLRGKILRIRINDDATYEIPEGNLFEKGTEKTRPEIYTMGHRNPYRISVDPKKGYLYWGDVGPDASADSLFTRGPRGYDEMNQAREAGNFGWPLFVGDNLAYHQYDYETGKSGPLFDPEKPINNSRNNTGLNDLPKAQPAMIWYPYSKSQDFPQVGAGGRTAMAGPVYYSDMVPGANGLPDYYNGKVIFYEWIRGWMKAVSLFENGDFNKMEPFAPLVKVNSLIDMELGPDGKIYLLEYGSGWFTKNPDSGLARIDYNGGNRPPVMAAFKVDKTSGILPFKIRATVTANDREKDAITYLWDFGDNTVKETTVPEIEHTYNLAGEFRISVEARDSKNASSKSVPVVVYAGNERPKVTIALSGNKSFYIPGVPLPYTVSVTDENGAEKIDPSHIFVSIDYLEGFDKAAVVNGHQEETALKINGKTIMLSSDCKTCHKESEKSIGPSFLQVSQKYKNDKKAPGYLLTKIMEGGNGVWGEVTMPKHPNLLTGDVQQIVSWILSLAESAAIKKSLPASGIIKPESSPNQKNTLVITASYTDKGGDNIKALTGTTTVTLPHNTVSFSGKIKLEGFTKITYNGTVVLLSPPVRGWFALGDIDLTEVNSVHVAMGWKGEMKMGYSLQAHLDAPDGKLIGKGIFPVPKKGQQSGMLSMKFEPVTDGRFHEIYFTYEYPDSNQKNDLPAGLISVRFDGK